MRDFNQKIAVVTGAGSGIGRALVLQLVSEGCNVAMCDLSESNLADTKKLCESKAANGARVSGFVCDVSDENQLLSVAKAVAREFNTDHIDLLFNNAGVFSPTRGSFVVGDRAHWEKVFNVNWYGVYYGTRVFLPMLMKAPTAHIINTSSINGFWPDGGFPMTSYAAAKFAVKGFTEALITDLEVNAPHIKCSVVMPGGVSTSLGLNSFTVLYGEEQGKKEYVKMLRQGQGEASKDKSDDEILALAQEASKVPTGVPSAEDAAKEILDGVREEKWRILVTKEAKVIDSLVRADPEAAYTYEFYRTFAEKANWSRTNWFAGIEARRAQAQEADATKTV